MTEPEPRGAPDSPADAPTDAGHDAAVRSAASAPKPDLAARLDALPRLGVGISGEYGVRPSIDPLAFLETHPGLIHFLEFGTDTERGLDPVIRRWVELGRPATYHFLDVNFEESEDLDEAWMTETGRLARALNAPWTCRITRRGRCSGGPRVHQRRGCGGEVSDLLPLRLRQGSQH